MLSVPRLWFRVSGIGRAAVGRRRKVIDCCRRALQPPRFRQYVALVPWRRASIGCEPARHLRHPWRGLLLPLSRPETLHGTYRRGTRRLIGATIGRSTIEQCTSVGRPNVKAMAP